MSRLARNLFDRRYADLVELGRSRLPSLAPDWTDHNAHDPGITLMELLAWVAEAQIYSLARSRRDERRAYAALMGIVPGGSRPARGLLWPDHDDPSSPAATISRHFIIERDRAVRTSKSELPTFRPAHRILWIPARIRALTTHLANGSVLNHTGANNRGGPAFQPFGERAGRRDVLSMELEATGDTPLFQTECADDARLVIGIRADAPRGGASAAYLEPARNCASHLEVMFSAGAERFPLKIVEDTSEGFMRTGACVLDICHVPLGSHTITLEFRAPRGFDRPPRILRIEPNVVPICQGRPVERELHDFKGLPDESFDLETPGLEFEPGMDPVKIEVAETRSFAEWKRCERFSDCGPDDRVYELDPVAARITFGNGVNGQIPQAGAQIIASYRVNDGTSGNIARNRKWFLQGMTGLFGVNPDPIAGGEDPSGWLEQRRKARGAKDAHALVSAADIETAARALTELEVGRAWIVPPQQGDIDTGVVTLVAMQGRRAGEEPEAIPETPRWLEAIRRRLSPRMPLGSRLVVAGPRYVEFSLRVRIEAEAGRDPAAVKRTVMEELRKRLTLVSETPGTPQRAFGVPVTRRDLTAWIQALPDVRRVIELKIRVANLGLDDEVKVTRRGLPRIDLAQSTIEIMRVQTGGSP